MQHIHKVEKVNVKENFVIEVCFLGGEVKQYDVKRLFPIFPQFCVFQENPLLFQKVSVDTGGYGISWNDELDLDADMLWEDGILIEVAKETDIRRLVAYQVLLAREKRNMTQKQLAEKTGIYQADISKIERGLANPSVDTLKRLADGLEMKLLIDFHIE